MKTHVLKDVDKGIEDMYDVAKVVELTQSRGEDLLSLYQS